MKKIGVVIQARMNSSRLKGKTLKYLDDKTLIEWIIKRLKKTKIKNIFLATGNLKENLELKKICNKERIIFFKGSESNVLDRFYNVSKQYKLDAVIRVCADNPFIDSKEINLLIKDFKKYSEMDYFFNHRNYQKITYADGFGAELIKFSTLKRLHQTVKDKYHKEHVTSWIWNNQNLFKMMPSKTNISKKYHHIVCDINNLNDYKKIKNFIKEKKISLNFNSNKISKLFSSYEVDLYLKDLFKMNRSLAGNENRKTLKYIKKNSPIMIRSFSSGDKVFNWTIPKEWEIKDGYIKDNFGNKLVDINNNNLHVASYSQPVKKILKLGELKKKIFVGGSFNEIPYRTLYYKKDWAFCLSRYDFKKIIKAYKIKNKFEIYINSKFSNGKMNYGEAIVKGKSKKEFLISTYICHPSMANDNLSGVILTSLLLKFIKNIPNLKWSYRIIFVPETIGAIAYTNKNLEKIKKIDYGINISCVGGRGNMSYKETKDKDSFLNKLVKNLFLREKIKYKKHDFDIHGSDERQYSYFGNDINVISVHKDKYYEYKEYHTSLDNLNFVKSSQILKSFQVYKKLIKSIEDEEIYISKNKYSETMLSKFNLYPDTGGSLMTNKNKKNKNLDNILWILFLCDGKRTLNQIHEKLKINKKNFFKTISLLKKKQLISHV